MSLHPNMHKTPPPQHIVRRVSSLHFPLSTCFSGSVPRPRHIRARGHFLLTLALTNPVQPKKLFVERSGYHDSGCIVRFPQGADDARKTGKLESSGEMDVLVDEAEVVLLGCAAGGEVGETEGALVGVGGIVVAAELFYW